MDSTTMTQNEEITVEITSEPTIVIDGFDTSFIGKAIDPEDIDYDNMRKHKPHLYVKYSEITNAIATAKTIRDLKRFEALKKEFYNIVKEIRENGFSYTENIKNDILRRLNKEKGRLHTHQYTFRTLLATEQSLMNSYEKNRLEIEKKQSEIEAIQREIKTLQATLPE